MSFSESSIYQINQQVNETGTTPDYVYSPLSYITRCKGCNKNLTSNTPASRYQIQKLIQNTVRVPSSIYTMNLAALNVYQRPNTTYEVASLGDLVYLISPGVNWNQMSDRANPHKQVVTSGNGLTGNSLKRTLTRLRPGALSPGGTGVDIKHNSYERYLNRIKGKAPLRRGPIPPTFALDELPFNRAYPVYGGKLFKTSIVNNCNCPIEDKNTIINTNIKDTILYEGSIIDEIYNIKYTFGVGDIVYTIKYIESTGQKELVKAKIVSINGELIKILFLDDNTSKEVFANDLRLYIPLRSSSDSCNTNDCCISINPYKKCDKEHIYVSCVLFNSL